MRELALRAHAGGGNCATVGGYEIHQPERKRLDTRMGRDAPHLAQRAVGLDQHMDRHIALEPARTRNGVDAARRHGDIGSRLGLGHHQVGQPPAAQGQQGVDFRFEGRVRHRMHARAHAAEAVRRGVDELCDQLRMLDFGADRGAVLGIERGIEDGRAELVA